MLRILCAGAVSIMVCVAGAHGADLPMFVPKQVHTKIVKKKSAAKVAAVAPVKLHAAVQKPVASLATAKQTAKIASKSVAAPSENEQANNSVNLSWTLGPLVANADGGKNEGSASITGNLIIDKPGAKIGPELNIELVGHIIKTPQSVVRLDVQIGDVKRTVTWKSDEIKSGTFKIMLHERLPAGVLPETFPASALAFVTKEGDGHAAMVSLEKINLRIGKLSVAGADDEQ